MMEPQKHLWGHAGSRLSTYCETVHAEDISFTPLPPLHFRCTCFRRMPLISIFIIILL